MKIIFLVKSVAPLWTQRDDVDYILKELIRRGNEIYVYDIKQRMLLNCLNGNVKRFFYCLKIFDKLLIFRFIINLFCFYRFLIKNNNSYDVCHILYLKEEELILNKYVRKLATKLIISFYGSDFNNKNIIKEKWTNLLHDANLVTATNPDLLVKIKQYYQLTDSTKTKDIMFPQIKLLNYTNFLFEDKFIYKNKLRIPLDKKVLTIGTNNSKNEQHLKILNELLSCSKESFFLIIPLTYGGTNAYRQKIINFVRSNFDQKNCRILVDYLSDSDVAAYRMASDIFINLRQNDQLACSLTESFLSYNLVVTGNWLPYQIYNKLGVYITELESISGLKNALTKLLSFSTNEIRKITFENKEKLKYNFNTENDLIKWMEVYN